ncbi:MAG: carboxypeptidase-like regulatory domain-containing protein [Bryobacteraceae bacterium]
MFAQDTRGKVQGLVNDSTGAVVAGSAVTLTNDNTAVSATQQTNQVGQYLFDFVIPGNYTVTVEMQGFRKYVQRNVLVQARGDVTVNATLEIGATTESVTVEAAPVAVQFNTSTMALTLDTKMANSLPIIHRNPFLLVSLNPATVIRSSTEQSPFHHWAASQFDVGGSTSTKNDIILDGSPSMTSQKSSYTPPMDAVQEVNLQQNAVDAEFGHSAGGVLSVSMKSGTNAFHGTGYYLGRNPVFNAMANRVNRAPNLTRQHTWGGTLGNPIKQNKIFNFFSYEGWRTIEPREVRNTLPTTAEAGGDFSKSINVSGGLRTIYDPWTTQTAGSTVTRTPFAGNIIPASRIDPTSKVVIGDLYKPNRPGIGNAQVDNFLIGYANRFRYWNFSDRVDWNISDKFKVFGRYNQFKTFTGADDYTNGSVTQAVDGSKRHSRSFSGDAVYTLNSSTVLNVRGAYNSITDSFGVPSATLTESDLGRFWGSNSWYKPYLADLPDIYYPGMTIATQGASTAIGKTGYWFQEPDSYNVEGKMSRSQGRHYWKVGGEYRKERTNASRPRPMSFSFNPSLTANTYLNPDTRTSGDGWATFLLGALDGGSNIQSIPIQKPIVDYVGLFLHDDFKITQRLAINLGIRYEYFTAMRDPTRRLSRLLDLNNAIPEFQGANAPQIPAAAAALRSAGPSYNGAWIFSDDSNPNSWNAPKSIFLPRLGLAWRANDKTAVRIGWARYVVPATLTDGLNILGSVPYPGFDALTATIAPLQGVPQQRLNDPYPGGLVPVSGKSLGRYTNLGGAATWYQQDFNPAVNDRINFSLQRQLPGKVLADITFFMNLGRNAPYTYDRNQIDPRIGYRVGNAVTQAVPNPFFGVLGVDKMPGTLRTQRTVPVSQLLRPYPQYTTLNETLVGGRSNRYKALQMQFQRPFANGFNFVLGYNYNRESNQEFYDEQDFYTNNLTWQPAANARHRFTGAGIYELPFGKGRKYGSGMHPFADAVLGGWSMSGLFTFNTGVFLRFGGLAVNGDPTLDNPTNSRWFDTSKFAILPAFTRRSNPWQYDKLTGPRFANIDMTLAKEFRILPEDRLKFELRGEAYNLVNAFSGNNPDLNVRSATFGRIIAQKPGVFGRQIQFSGRFVF